MKRRSWGEPQQVDGLFWPTGVRTTMTTVLFRDLVLRLERTKLPQALVVPFDSEDMVRRMRRNLTSMAHQRLGRGHIRFAQGEYMGKPALWVKRGPSWGENNAAFTTGEHNDER